MAIYGISDLHLSLNDKSKSMEAFGDKWENYEERIKENWEKTVKKSDTVIISGDISWAMRLEDAVKDFEYIDKLPGRKIILKGNHDYYFSTVKKMQEFLRKNNFNTIEILHNNSYVIEDTVICGTRGWGNISEEGKEVDNKKIFSRELGRLKMSLDSIKEEYKNKDIIVAQHFPVTRHEFKNLMKEYNVKKCIYGHLHGDGHYMVREGIEDGIEYIMVGCDYTGFKLVRVK